MLSLESNLKDLIKSNDNSSESICKKVKCQFNTLDNYAKMMELYLGEDVKINVFLNKKGIEIFYKGSLISKNTEYFFKEEMYVNDVLLDFEEDNIVLNIPNELFDNTKGIKDDFILEKMKLKNYPMDKYEYLKSCNVSNTLISLLLDRYDESLNIEKPKTLYLDESKTKVLSVLVKVLLGGHVRLFGIQSTGKNTLVDSISWLINRPIIKFPGYPFNTKEDLIGETNLKVYKDEEGKSHVITEYQERALIDAMRNGKILLLDEVNANNPAVLIILNGPMDKSRSILLPTGETIHAHKNFSVIATMNENFLGTSKLNQAFIDRMASVELNTYDSIVNILKAERPNVDIDTLNFLDKFYKKIIKLIKNDSINDTAFSIRGFLDYIDFIEYGVDKDVAIRDSIINRIQDVEFREILINSLDIS